MEQVVIENPVINSPFAEPERHFRFADEGITNEIVEGRRPSSYFVPIPRAKTRGKQLLLPDTQWTQDRVEENPTINRIRGRVAQWRQGGYVVVTTTTRRLLEYWQQEEREQRFFFAQIEFAQIEALETAIYITEVAGRYRALDVAPPDLLPELNKARIVITNFHAFKPREKVSAGKLTKAVLAGGASGAFMESPGEMVRRVCRELGTKRNVVVINDEAHHCYRRRVGGDEVKLTGDERKEAEQREEEARVWISGLEAVKEKIGVRMVYDLSATPFFPRGSGYSEGTLFPWVVADFSLIDAIESGVVKVPRVPVSDDAVTSLQPTFRDLWPHIRDGLPKKGRKTEAVEGQPVLPVELQAALLTLYGNYEKHYQRSMGRNGGDGPHPRPLSRRDGRGEPELTDERQLMRTRTPPVFIVV